MDRGIRVLAAACTGLLASVFVLSMNGQPVVSVSAETLPPMVVDVSATQPAQATDRRMVLLTLQNRHDADILSDVQAKLSVQGAADSLEPLSEMMPGQSTHAEFDLPAGAANATVTVTYTWRGLAQSVIRAVPAVTLPPPDPTLGPMISGLAGLGGALLGFIGILVSQRMQHGFTRRRELDRGLLELKRSFWDKHGEAYQNFLANWRGLADAKLLREAFTQLESAHWVHPDVRCVYESTLAALNSNSTLEAKQIECLRLRAAVDTFIASLGPGLTD
jgi:hypothetical protein